jgi:hypothetical protein
VEENRPQRPASRHKRSGQPLRQYRLYFLESVVQRISYSHEFEAEDDEQAISISESWREGRSAELWAGSRKVKDWRGDR